jgi:DNA-binding MarR family transcriptional regulator
MLTTRPSLAAFYLGVTPTEEKILCLIHNNPGIITTQVSEAAHLPITNTSKHLSTLLHAGLIKRNYDRQYSRWSVTDPLAHLVLAAEAQQ